MLTDTQWHMLSTPARDDRGYLIPGSLNNAGVDNRTAVALCRKGMIDWEPGRHFGGRWVITEAGHAEIARRADVVAPESA